MDYRISIALIVMGGIVLSIIAWQVLAIGKAAARGVPADVEDLRRRVDAIESELGKSR